MCGIIVAWRLPIEGDPGWLLWLARRTLHGAVVYRDLWDTNPPLSHWILIPPAALTEWAGWSQQSAFNCYVLAWCAASLLLVREAWRRWPAAPLPTTVAVSAGAVALFMLPGPFFGQREHFMLASALPWLVTLAIWRSGDRLDGWLPVVAAGGIAISIALKPFYLGWWLMAPLLTRRALRTPAFWLVPAVGLAYLIVVARTPFPAYARDWAGVYWRYAHRPLWFVAVGNPFALLAIGSAAISATAVRRSTLGATLWGATLAAWLGATAQGKALPYHFYPATVLSLFLLMAASRATRRGVGFPVTAVWAAYVVWFVIVGVAREPRNAAALNAAVGKSGVMVLSAAADDAWLLTTEYGRPWLSTHYDLWWLAISGGRDTVPGIPDWPRRNDLLRRSLLIPALPDVLLLGEEEVSIGDYLAGSPDWKDSLATYRRAESVAGYRIRRRRTLR